MLVREEREVVSKVFYRWDIPAHGVPGWYVEAWIDDRLAEDSQKIYFPVDVDRFGEDDSEELEDALHDAFPNAEIEH